MKFIKRLLIFALICILIGSGTIFGLYLHLKPELPNVDALKHVELQTPMQIYSSDGQLISQFGEKRRIPLTLNEIPKELVEAFIATEDSRFYEHGGIDPIGIARAALAVAVSGHAVQGASTITQQLARNFFLSNKKTLTRKLKEIFIAIHIDHVLTKDEILQLYLNKIYLGHRAYGVGAAAQVYFGKNVNQLTLSEMAMIAGLPKAPSTMNPLYSLKRATERRNVVLMRMLSEHYITQVQYDQARAAKIQARYHGAEIQLHAPYVAEMTRAWMHEHYGDKIYTQGFKVFTTINTQMQKDANQAATENLLNYSERHGYLGPQATLWKPSEEAWNSTRIETYLKKQPTYGPLFPAIVTAVEKQSATVTLKNDQTITLAWDGLKWARRYLSDTRQGSAPKTAHSILKAGQQIWITKKTSENKTTWVLSQIPKAETAFIAMSPKNGAINALVGGFNYSLSKFNRATQSVRQVGSNFKPFVYSAGLNSGLTLASLINNAPINHWNQSGGTAWRPKNSPPIYTGPTRFNIGLAQSVNVMAIRILRHVGLNQTIDFLHRFDFPTSALPKGEALALGAGSMTPMQLLRGYATFSNGGYLVQPFFVEKVETPMGKVIYQANPAIAGSPSSTSDSINPHGLTFQEHSVTPSNDENTTTHYAPQVISSQNAFLMEQMLKANIWGGGNWKYGNGWQGTGWRAKSLKRHDIGGKTGTTNDSRDTWYTGFAPGIVATSWVGFDNHNKLGYSSWNKNLGKTQTYGAESGGKTALAAWITFMKLALKNTPDTAIPMPDNIVQVRIDRATGLLTTKTDGSSKFEYFIKGTQPKSYVKTTLTNSVQNSQGEEEDLF